MSEKQNDGCNADPSSEPEILDCQEGCAALGIKAECCGSCHSDYEDGYDQADDLDIGGGRTVYACCGVWRALSDAMKERSR